MFTVLQRRVVHAVDNSTEDGVAEEDGCERSGTARQPKLQQQEFYVGALQSTQ